VGNDSDISGLLDWQFSGHGLIIFMFPSPLARGDVPTKVGTERLNVNLKLKNKNGK